jgi:putative phosphoserine phosphatase/1-acylglycerol-3-phosphate O-acyltransferase
VTPFHRTAAVFDVDDSLLDGNAGTIFTWYLYSQRVLRADVRQKLPRALYDFARRRLGEADMVALASRSHIGIRADVLKDHARRCFERHIRKRVTADGMRAIRRHLLAGHLTILASGSPQAIVDELGHFLNVHVAIGTRALIREGVMTDELLPPVSFREGKRERVRQICDEYGIDLSRSYLYSDSVADTPLFERVGHPIVVNAKTAFRQEGERRGWEVQEWKGRWAAAKSPVSEEFPVEEWGSWEA